ncbi:MAG TPA: M15 family metallopeptidase [Ohtaekwangia sp.]|nr:M15 family metallopeptidase [Ohtaekwangia sp.]
MRIFCKTLTLLLLLVSLTAEAQLEALFAPFAPGTNDGTASTIEIPKRYPVIEHDHSEPEEHVVDNSEEAWKSWSYVENFTFGKDRGSMPMITDLNALHPYFRDKIRQLIVNCNAQGIELAIVESYRTHAKQNEYKVMGRKYTSSGAGRSKHQYGLAADVVPIVDSVAVWDNPALWRKIGLAGEKLGLRWGGRWRKPFDPGHFEWTGGLTSGHLARGILPPVPPSQYPCVEEDIELLRKFWKAWETSQSVWTRK